MSKILKITFGIFEIINFKVSYWMGCKRGCIYFNRGSVWKVSCCAATTKTKTTTIDNSSLSNRILSIHLSDLWASSPYSYFFLAWLYPCVRSGKVVLTPHQVMIPRWKKVNWLKYASQLGLAVIGAMVCHTIDIPLDPLLTNTVDLLFLDVSDPDYFLSIKKRLS